MSPADRRRAAEALARMRRQQRDQAALRLATLTSRRAQASARAAEQALRLSGIERELDARFAANRVLDPGALAQAQRAIESAHQGLMRLHAAVEHLERECEEARGALLDHRSAVRLAEKHHAGILREIGLTQAKADRLRSLEAQLAGRAETQHEH